MEDRRLKEEYKVTFDNIHAPEYLKKNILEMKVKKRNHRPVIAFASTVAAAAAIFASAGSYDFTDKDNSGVIEEVSVMEDAVQTKAPSYTHTSAEETEEIEAQTQIPQSIETPTPVQKSVSATPKTAKATAVPKNTPSAMKKATQKPIQNNTSQMSGKISNTAKPVDIAETEEANKVMQTAVPEPMQTPQAALYEKSETADEKQDVQEKQAIMAEEPDINETQLVSQTASDESIDTQTAKMRASGGGSAISAKTEEWDNNRYFDYIGTDIIKKTEQSSSFSYIGAETNFVTVDADGAIINDEWNFAFERPGGGYINIITTKKSSQNTESLALSGTEITDIGGINAVLSDNHGSFTCYVQHNGVSFTIYSSSVTKEEVIDLLTRLVS